MNTIPDANRTARHTRTGPDTAEQEDSWLKATLLYRQCGTVAVRNVAGWLLYFAVKNSEYTNRNSNRHTDYHSKIILNIHPWCLQLQSGGGVSSCPLLPIRRRDNYYFRLLDKNGVAGCHHRHGTQKMSTAASFEKDDGCCVPYPPATRETHQCSQGVHSDARVAQSETLLS